MYICLFLSEHRRAQALYYTIIYYTILYCTVLYYTTLYYTVLYYTIHYYTILHYTILHYTTLYYTILYYTILSCTIRFPPEHRRAQARVRGRVHLTYICRVGSKLGSETREDFGSEVSKSENKVSNSGIIIINACIYIYIYIYIHI